jgi:hypothetical protein
MDGLAQGILLEKIFSRLITIVVCSSIAASQILKEVGFEKIALFGHEFEPAARHLWDKLKTPTNNSFVAFGHRNRPLCQITSKSIKLVALW